MGLFLNALATKYGVVVQGDYKGCNVGGSNNNIAILKTFGKPITYKKEDIESYEIKSRVGLGTTNVAINFKDGKRSLVQFTPQGITIFESMMF